MTQRISQREARKLRARVKYLEAEIAGGDAIVERHALSNFSDIGKNVLNEVKTAGRLGFRVEVTVSSNELLCLSGVRRAAWKSREAR
jgi:hypothetical protein